MKRQQEVAVVLTVLGIMQWRHEKRIEEKQAKSEKKKKETKREKERKKNQKVQNGGSSKIELANGSRTSLGHLNWQLGSQVESKFG